MTVRTLSGEEQAKLRGVVEKAIQILNDIKDLREAKNDAVRTLAKDLEIPLKDLNKAINIAFKKKQNPAVLDDEKDRLDTAEELLLLSKQL